MKKVKVKIAGNWVETVAINGSTSGFSYQSWLNYVAVKKGTKTTIEAGDIDVSGITGANSAYAFLYGCSALTKINLNYITLNGANSLNTAFAGCTNLNTIIINLSAANTNGIFIAILASSLNVNNLTINGLFNSAYALSAAFKNKCK